MIDLGRGARGVTTAGSTRFGALLRTYRLAAGLTQEELAERAGLSGRGIQDLERGARRTPMADTVRRVAQALQLDSVARAELLSAARPNAGLAAESSTLPVALTSLIGREQELVELANRLADTRLLTLTGVGGCGKTRLALEVARSRTPNSPGEVTLIELGSVSDPATVPQHVASRLDVREQRGQPLTAALVEALRARRMLLVLDNCEHLLHACAQLIDALLRGCPTVQVLTTSREPIGVEGEVAWRVPSLAVPDEEDCDWRAGGVPAVESSDR
jgi:transcriptional regulator with XRE-family HTH domain